VPHQRLSGAAANARTHPNSQIFSEAGLGPVGTRTHEWRVRFTRVGRHPNDNAPRIDDWRP